MNIVKKLLSLPLEKYKAVCSQLTPKDLHELELQLARESFYHFAKYISKTYDETVDMTFPTYYMVCKVVEAFIENRLFNENGKRIDILFLNACPGWGKSYLVTRLLNLWWLAKNHKLQYVITAN